MKDAKLNIVSYPRAEFPLDVIRCYHTKNKIVTYSYLSGHRNIRGKMQGPNTEMEIIYPEYHEGFELLFVCDGCMNISIQGNQYLADNSRIFFINPYEYHRAHLTEEMNPVEYITVIGKIDIIQAYTKQYQNILAMLEAGSMRLNNTINSPDERFNIVQKIIYEIVTVSEQKQFGWELYLEGQLHCLLGTLLSDLAVPPTAESVNAESDFLSKVTRYVNQNLKSKITLSSIAEHIGYNPKYFCRLFKASANENFIDYVNRIRIERAKTLLLSDISVTLAAGNCGFDNLSYFSKKFKQYTGLSPNEYRRIYSNTKEEDASD